VKTPYDFFELLVLAILLVCGGITQTVSTAQTDMRTVAQKLSIDTRINTNSFKSTE
jgi:nitrate reductase gamma subunit